ncbi:sensor histidine kinase [Piscinibacter sakaiensis]|uniref:histidine kinase n=1 Tax=Piscinibacter sakaiensis TaxID=1547922 RepID=A0A0K8NTM7_PISS1|nr:ATP-binding protein [Piscinibacter sakaiensis]GAP33766.1 sensory box histidine kinase [Piscinibacter sakaiensis]
MHAAHVFRAVGPAGRAAGRVAALLSAAGAAAPLRAQALAATAPPAPAWVWPALLGLALAALAAALMLALRLQRAERAAREALADLQRRVAADAAAAAASAPTPVAAPAPAPADDEAARRSAAAQAEQEAFSYTVSHDLRAPIRVVEGFTKILKEDYGRVLDRVGIDHLDRVLGAAARMNAMIDALLALSQLSTQPLARQPVNLSQLAGYVAEDLRRQQPEREVLLSIDADMEVQGDPTLLRVVIENLLANAWKYTAKCAQPEISFRRHPAQPRTFTIADNGAGFDMRFADRLFGVFQRLHSATDYHGTGIGLASVRRIIRRHGGDIWAEAEVGHGARFHFSLP